MRASIVALVSLAACSFDPSGVGPGATTADARTHAGVFDAPAAPLIDAHVQPPPIDAHVVAMIDAPPSCGPCGPGETCVAGTCWCDGNGPCFIGTCCPGQGCVDLTSDQANCGACGSDCGSDACVSSTCVACNMMTCPSGLGTAAACCSDGCTNLCNDSNHCGSCGHACTGGTDFCLNGTCLFSGGPPAPMGCF
jgi:hypothetical protein